MKRLWISTSILLSALFALLLILVRVIGAAQAPPEELAALHMTDCQLPCWLGIVAGKTTLDQAARQVAASHPESIDTYPSQNTIQVSYQVGSLTVPVEVIADRDGTVREIILETAHLNGVYLGNLASLYGTPACTSNTKLGKVVYGAPTIYASIPADNRGRGIWHGPLNDIEIRSYDWIANPCASS